MHEIIHAENPKGRHYGEVLLSVGKICQWCRDNCKYDYENTNTKYNETTKTYDTIFRFACYADAMAFKIMWS